MSGDVSDLKNETYMVRHNPNCPKAFEVRLSGLGLLTAIVSRKHSWRDPFDGDDK